MTTSSVDTLWLLLASFLVLTMQGGFLLLEGGRVRSKNSINVAQKNVSDLMVAWVGFFLFGFYLMYGVAMPISGSSSPSSLEFLFNLGFCATAASIVSGGVAERFRFVPYLVLAFLIGGLLYPITGRLVWGDKYIDAPFTFLADIGFVDFAGATVVHSLGAWAALVAILMIGPRIDRFDSKGKPKTLSSHSSIMSLQGALLLAFGWIGFNAGAISVSDPLMAEIVVNTFSAAAFGAAGGAAIGAYMDGGVFNPARTINGLLGGLVTSTAAIHVMHAYEAMFFGFLGGVIATGGAEFLLRKFKFDDPVDVVATHGVCGLFGTLLFAFVAPLELLVNGSRLQQFAIQLGGSAAIFALVTSVTYTTLKLASLFTTLRVTEDEERIGLNYSEHGESIGTDRLRRALDKKVKSDTHFARPLQVDDQDEHAELAATVNQLITRHEQARAEISRSEKMFQQFANTASDWLWECSDDLILQSLSITKKDESKYDSSKWINQSLFDLIDFKADELATIKEAVRNEQSFGPIDGCIRLNENDRSGDSLGDDNLFVEIRGTFFTDVHQNNSGFRGTITDITPRKLAENRALFLSLHDELTGLLNRRALQKSLPSVLRKARRSTDRVAVITIDLDGFKAVNDSYGHAAGDVLLCNVAKRIEDSLDENCHIYRTGGDEFILIVRGLSEESIQKTVDFVGKQTLGNIQLPVPLEGKDVHVAASLGVAIYPEHATTSTELLRRSDLAMYSAKQKGKSQIVWFDPDLDNDMDYLFKMKAEVQRAIENDELFLEYQPQIDAQNNKILAFEALVRWDHPKKGLLSPFEFISNIEKHGLMPLVGNFVLETACEFASTWQPNGDEDSAPRISINISPSQLISDNFSQHLIETLARVNLSPSRVELEITEDAIINNIDEALAVITPLEKMGIHFSIDDFGTGQTSLRYLNKFPVSTMKMDRSFIRNIGKNERAAEITRSIIAMGARLGYNVVAEGVEEQQQLDILKKWNCPTIQGYLFSKPISQSEVIGMLEANNHQELKKAS